MSESQRIKNEGRAQLFELLRQGHQADTTTERMRHIQGQDVSSEELFDLQHAALNSLQAGYQTHLL